MNTMVKKVIYTTLAGAMFGIIPLSLQAEATPMRGPASFSSFDTNNDGVITKKEFNYTHQKRMQERSEAGMPMRNAGNAPKFRFFDENGDGKITKKEFANAHKERMQKRIQQRDDYGMGMGKGMNKGQMGKCGGSGKGPNR